MTRSAGGIRGGGCVVLGVVTGTASWRGSSRAGWLETVSVGVGCSSDV